MALEIGEGAGLEIVAGGDPSIARWLNVPPRLIDLVGGVPLDDKMPR